MSTGQAYYPQGPLLPSPISLFVTSSQTVKNMAHVINNIFTYFHTLVYI